MSSKSYPTRALGGSAKHLQVGQVAFGCMGMTWVDPKNMTPDQQAFETIKAAVDAGSNFINSGSFYGPASDPYANLKLLRRFYDAHPEYKAKTILSVKGGMTVAAYAEKGMAGLSSDASVQHLESDLHEIRKMLGSDQPEGKQLDVYEMARRDTNVSVEEAMYNMLSLSSQTYVDAQGQEQTGKGLFDHISLSEVGLETIQAANKVAPIACIEIEVSPWEREAFDRGIVDFCAKEGIPILAYSPTGKGMLAANITSTDEIPQGDLRSHLDRFQKEHLSKNLELAHQIRKAAESQSPPVTPTQLGLAWLIASGPTPGTIIPLPGTTKAARARENAAAATINVDQATQSSINDIITSFNTSGGRYSEMARKRGLWS